MNLPQEYTDDYWAYYDPWEDPTVKPPKAELPEMPELTDWHGS